MSTKEFNEGKTLEEITESIIQRFDRIAKEILINGEDIITRRLSGEVVDKEEMDNQKELLKTLRVISQTLTIIKKTGRLPGMEDPDEFGGLIGNKIVDRVKNKKSSVASIIQKYE